LTDGSPSDDQVLTDGSPSDDQVLTDGSPSDDQVLTDGIPSDDLIFALIIVLYEEGPISFGRDYHVFQRW
jgi:hypothetical protein